MAVCMCQAVYYYFVMVETKGRTLEELNMIFEARNPRKAASLKKEDIEENVAKAQQVKAAV